MHNVLVRVGGFGDALRIASAANPGARANVDHWIGGIRRKAAVVGHHLSLLRQVPWREIPDLGRQGPQGPLSSTIRLDGFEVRLASHMAATDWVYSSLDGAVSGIANITDTMGRALNEAYGLGVNVRQANLVVVGGEMHSSCAVGALLQDPTARPWWEAMRQLRGECQHGCLEQVLDGSGFVGRAEPVVRQAYLYTGAAGAEVGAYVQGLSDAVETLCLRVITEVERRPATAVKPK
jgi:hypothetical protein